LPTLSQNLLWKIFLNSSKDIFQRSFENLSPVSWYASCYIFTFSCYVVGINMCGVSYILEMLMPIERRYLNVLDNGSTSIYHEMVQMMFTLPSCIGECGWRQAAIHSSLCLDRALAHWFWAGRHFLPAFLTSTLTQWAMPSPFHCSGC